MGGGLDRVWGARSGWEGGQGGCERRIEVFVKIQKKKSFFFWGGGGGQRREGSGWGGGGGGGGQVGCDRRIEDFGKIHKKKIQGGGRFWGVRVGGSGWM